MGSVPIIWTSSPVFHLSENFANELLQFANRCGFHER